MVFGTQQFLSCATSSLGRKNLCRRNPKLQGCARLFQKAIQQNGHGTRFITDSAASAKLPLTSKEAADILADFKRAAGAGDQPVLPKWLADATRVWNRKRRDALKRQKPSRSPKPSRREVIGLRP